MGGAASATIAVGDIEDMVACSLLLGRAIAAISFPDMYRIYDFHCKDAPPLFALDDDDDDLPDLVFLTDDKSSVVAEMGSPKPDDDEEGMEKLAATEIAPEEEKPEKVYKTEGLFELQVGEETVYLEDVNFQNQAGWLALHACCHSQATGQIGVQLIEEMVRTGRSNFDVKTKRGPGPFNAGWTPLHMAAAYGVRPIVEKLLEVGADPNAENSITWTPLMECCHRGFTHLAQLLVNAGAKIDHLPDAEICSRAPFLRAPPQSPLGEAARVGASEIVKFLIDRGADKDMVNSLGWSPLHEAAFYNHKEVVQTLLVYGADSTLKTKQGAIPYQLACVPAIKEMIKDMGGPDAVAEDPSPFSMLAMMTGASFEQTPQNSPALEADVRKKLGTGEMELVDSDAEGGRQTQSTKDQARRQKNKQKIEEPSKAERTEEKPLHSGGLIGDLPALNKKPQVVHPKRKVKVSKKQKLKMKAEPKNDNLSPSKINRPPDAPQEYLCELTQNLLRDPVRTPYGHVFEKKIIAAWFKTHGSICPLTGQPLAPNELRLDDELKNKITEWQMKKTLEQNEAFQPTAGAPDGSKQDDLYDF